MTDPIDGALTEVVRDFGRLVGADPDRLRALLTDVLGEQSRPHRGAIDAVVLAAEEGVPALVERGDTDEVALARARLVAGGLAISTADAAIRAWGTALAARPGPVETPTPPAPSLPPTPDAEPAPKPQSPPPRRRLGVVASLAAALAVATLVVVAVLRPDPEPIASQPSPDVPVVATTAAPTTSPTGSTTTTETIVLGPPGATLVTAATVATTPPTTPPTSPPTTPPTTPPAPIDYATLDVLGAGVTSARFNSTLNLLESDNVSLSSSTLTPTLTIERQGGAYLLSMGGWVKQVVLVREGAEFTATGTAQSAYFSCTVNGDKRDSETAYDLRLKIRTVVPSPPVRVVTFEVAIVFTAPADRCTAAVASFQGVAQLR